MTSHRVLVTGVNGFVGQHLAHVLHVAGYAVFGVGREVNPKAWVEDCVDDYVSIDLERNRLPDMDCLAVVHLAARSSVAASFARPADHVAGNVKSAVAVLEWAVCQHASPRVLLVSSGAVYDPAQSLPLPESANVLGTSPYAISKIASEEAARYYRHRGLDVVTARPFNHIGPRQGPGFLVADAITKLQRHLQMGEPLQFGDLSTERDYTDVRDVARAYALILGAPRLSHVTYNVCSGSAVTGRHIVETLCDIAGASPAALFSAEGSRRPTDPSRSSGDPSRLRDELGWRGQIPLRQSLADAWTAARQ